jgi:protein-L-isoaspartate O-methyltransferase
VDAALICAKESPVTAAPEAPDYGIDAPGVIRNLLIAGFAGLAVAVLVRVGVLPAALSIHPSEAVDIRFPLFGTGLGMGLGFSAAALWMYFGSRYGKIAERDKLLNRIDWRGDERVLDVGCGRGLVLVGAAKRLTSGSAVGVDIWQQEDLSGNRAEVPLKNAALEGVADRVKVETADMRKLPFPDASFDVVVTRAAIHNIYSAPERARAIAEIARVLKPDGRAVVNDIRHLNEYAANFAAAGCGDARFLDSKAMGLLCMLVTMGSLRPNTIVVNKMAAKP